VSLVLWVVVELAVLQKYLFLQQVIGVLGVVEIVLGAVGTNASVAAVTTRAGSNV
jgi:hypothetical protein